MFSMAKLPSILSVLQGSPKIYLVTDFNLADMD
jgi:hypothetical protein